MKTLFEGYHHDFTLQFKSIQKKDEGGELVWTDKGNLIARCQQKLDRVSLMVRANNEDHGIPVYHKVEITRDDLFALVREVEEQEKMETDEFRD